MLDLIKGRGRSVYSSRDAVIYLFNIQRFVGFHPLKSFGVLSLLVTLLSPIIFNVGWIRDRHILPLTEILTCVQVALNSLGVPIRTITLVFSLKRLRSIEPLLMDLDARYTEAEDLIRIRHCAITGNRIVVVYIFSYMMYEILTIISAIISGHAPLTLWIPYVNWHRSLWEYWLQVSLEAFILFYIILYQILNDSYAAVYIYIIRTQVQLLATRVKRLKTLSHSRNGCYNELQQCIIIHQDILRLVNIVEPILSVTMFAQFLIAAAILSITMINIINFADLGARIASCTYLFCVLLETSPTCFFVTYLQADCEKLSLAIFHNNWIIQDKRLSNLLIFFLHRSQKGIPLFAMKLIPINLYTSVSIAKFSFSLYTFIQKMGLGRERRS